MKKKKKKKPEISRKQWRLYKKSAAYKMGRRDAVRCLKQFSVWFASAVSFYGGFQRKEIKGEFYVWSYSEGFQDVIDKRMKELGMKPRKMYYPETSEIGKELNGD